MMAFLKKIYFWYLLFILILGFALRITNLDTSPPGFNADEASLGYNAYSILQTGKDEWGESFPLVFKSFSDYKPGLYVYLSIPFIAMLGLSELSVRFPSIILGTISILVIYLLAKELFKKETVALSAAFLLAVSPWHLHFSRGAWETNVASFFIALGVLGFIKGLKDSRFFLLSAISWIASMYTYQSPRILIPLLILVLGVSYIRKINFRKIIIPLIIGAILIIPLIFIVFNNKGLARFQGVSIFTDIGPGVKINQDRGEHENPGDFSAKIFHNKLSAYGLNFLEHYFDHFTPKFLFTFGDPLGRNKIPEMGQLYLFEVITLLLGFYFLIINKFNNTKVIIIWLIIAPVAASLTYQTPHALRSHNMVFPLILISGLGLGLLLEKISKLKHYFNFLAITFCVLVITFFVTKFFHQYYIHLPKKYALEWEYGFSKVVPYAFKNIDKYERIVVTDRYDQPYILFLFYSKYDPRKYQATVKPTGIDKFGFSTITSFDKFNFRPIGKEEIHSSRDTLFIGTGEEIGDIEIIDPKTYQGPKILKQINFPNDSAAFKVVGYEK